MIIILLIKKLKFLQLIGSLIYIPSLLQIRMNQMSKRSKSPQHIDGHGNEQRQHEHGHEQTTMAAVTKLIFLVKGSDGKMFIVTVLSQEGMVVYNTPDGKCKFPLDAFTFSNVKDKKGLGLCYVPNCSDPENCGYKHPVDTKLTRYTGTLEQFLVLSKGLADTSKAMKMRWILKTTPPPPIGAGPISFGVAKKLVDAGMAKVVREHGVDITAANYKKLIEISQSTTHMSRPEAQKLWHLAKAIRETGKEKLALFLQFLATDRECRFGAKCNNSGCVYLHKGQKQFAQKLADLKPVDAPVASGPATARRLKLVHFPNALNAKNGKKPVLTGYGMAAGKGAEVDREEKQAAAEAKVEAERAKKARKAQPREAPKTHVETTSTTPSQDLPNNAEPEDEYGFKKVTKGAKVAKGTKHKKVDETNDLWAQSEEWVRAFNDTETTVSSEEKPKSRKERKALAAQKKKDAADRRKNKRTRKSSDDEEDDFGSDSFRKASAKNASVFAPLAESFSDDSSDSDDEDDVPQTQVRRRSHYIRWQPKEAMAQPEDEDDIEWD